MHRPLQYSIIIPVYEEKDTIRETLGHLNAIMPSERCEVIISDGTSTGSTIAGINDYMFKGIIAAKGRASQMNAGALEAAGDVLLFLHADTLLSPGSFEMIDEFLKNDNYVGGAFSLHINSSRLIYRIVEQVASLRTCLSRIPYGDQGIFIRKDYFINIGKYRDIPLMEDIDLMKRIRSRGDRIALLPLKVKTSARRWESEGILYCTMRNWSLRLLYSWGVSPEKLAGFYR